MFRFFLYFLIKINLNCQEKKQKIVFINDKGEKILNILINKSTTFRKYYIVFLDNTVYFNSKLIACCFFVIFINLFDYITYDINSNYKYVIFFALIFKNNFWKHLNTSYLIKIPVLILVSAAMHYRIVIDVIKNKFNYNFEDPEKRNLERILLNLTKFLFWFIIIQH